MKRTLAIFLSLAASFAITLGFAADPQRDAFVGTFAKSDDSVWLQIKPVGSKYHGVFKTMMGWFALEATKKEGRLEGRIAYQAEAIPFVAARVDGGLRIEAFGYSDVFSMRSYEHGIGDLDLTPHLPPRAASDQGRQPAPNGGGGDYTYGYSHATPGLESEEHRTPPKSTAPAPPAEGHDDPELLQIISGSQLVFYRRTSILSDTNASSLTYVNFCPDGRFTTTYDSSFSVEGEYGGNAHGAGHGRLSGTWQLVRHQGATAVRLVYADGTVSLNPVDRNEVRQGRWRNGNLHFALQRGKAVCR